MISEGVPPTALGQPRRASIHSSRRHKEKSAAKYRLSARLLDPVDEEKPTGQSECVDGLAISATQSNCDGGLTNRYSVADAPPLDMDRRASARHLPEWKKRAKLILPHIGLVVLSIFYTVFGGAMFYFIEYPNEVDKKRHSLVQIETEAQNLSINLRSISSDVGDEEWADHVSVELDKMMKVLFHAFHENSVTYDDIKYNETSTLWTFGSALFFSFTVITTIGYGHLVPHTDIGRAMCVLFGLFGIPLILVTVADLGKFLSEYVASVYDRYMSVLKWVLGRMLKCVLQAMHIPEFLWRELIAADPNEALPDDAGSDDEMRLLLQEPEVPVIFVFVVWIAFTAIGAGVIGYVEGWSFLNAFYYCFTTVTTIGFGDIVPDLGKNLVITSIYIIVGLIITTMCIDLVGSQYIRKIHFLGRNIKRARYTLTHLGDRMVHIGDVIRYMSILQKTYGLTSDDLERLGTVPEDILLDLMLRGKPLPPHLRGLFSRPFIPLDWRLIKWIDSRSTNSYRSERAVASLDSFEIYSLSARSNGTVTATSSLCELKSPRKKSKTRQNGGILRFWKSKRNSRRHSAAQSCNLTTPIVE